MFYQWDSTLETGYDVIDNQHKQLVAAVNDLLDACRNGKGKEAIASTMDFLTGYTIKHFMDEEKIQIKYNYPDFLTHKRYHDEFKVLVGRFTRRLIREGPTELIINDVCASIGDWLLNHIKGDDFRMAAYIKAKDAARKNAAKRGSS
ncbi:MAG: bacteriohemerythrin [Treponema sp.]|nr:bacteriohemerythrin [Treponema sp.]